MIERRIGNLPAILAAAILLFSPVAGIAGDDVEIEGKAVVGGHYSDVNDEVRKVREYDLGRDIYQSDLWLDFFGRSDENRLEASMSYYDERTMDVWMRADAGRHLTARFDYRSFHHWLDHDLLQNMTYREVAGFDSEENPVPGGKMLTVEDTDPFGMYNIRYSQAKQRIDIRLPEMGGVEPSLRAEYTEQRRFGATQAIGVDHCSNCHLRSHRMNVNERNQTLRGTVSALTKHFRVWYDFLGRRFINDAAPPINRYMKARHPSSYGPSGTDPDFSAGEFGSRVLFNDTELPLGTAPDMEKQTHAIRVRAELPASNTVTGAFSYAKVENLRTEHEMTSQAYSLGWYSTITPKLRLTAGAMKRKVENDDVFVDLPLWRASGAGGGQDFDWTRYSAYNRDDYTAKASLVYALAPGQSAGVHYRFRSIDRDHVALDPDDPDETETVQNRIRGAWSGRFGRKVRARAHVEYEATDHPFVAVGGLCEPDLGDTIMPVGDSPQVYYFQRVRTGTGANLPSSAVRGRANVSLSPSPKFSLTGYVNMASEKNDDLNVYEWERTVLSPGAMAYLIPTSRVALSGGVSYSKIESNAKICIPVFDG